MLTSSIYETLINLQLFIVGGIAGILNIWFSHWIGSRGLSRLSLLTFTHLFISFFLFPKIIKISFVFYVNGTVRTIEIIDFRMPTGACMSESSILELNRRRSKFAIL